MSALLDNLPRYRRMMPEDLDAIMHIETRIYPHPWTRGNFSDSLEAGYHCWVMEMGREIVGYAVVTIAVGEAHLLNLSIALPWQRQGLGTELLRFLIDLARESAARKAYLEVRPSNVAGRALYANAGFREIATRRGYYPCADGREDAVVMEMQVQNA